jgi:hypothetical protein
VKEIEVKGSELWIWIASELKGGKDKRKKIETTRNCERSFRALKEFIISEIR